MKEEEGKGGQLSEELKRLRKRVAELEQVEERIKHLNLVLHAIRSVNQLIVKERDRDRLLQGACDRLIETRGYYNAWIALLDESGGLVATAEAGLGEAFLPLLERLKRGELTACGQEALSQSGVVVTDDPPSACADCPLSTSYAGRGALTVRLEHGGKVYGLLSASIPAHLTADEEKQTLFEEVAADIAFALHGIELEEKRVRAEEALVHERDLLQALMDNIPDTIYFKDTASRFTRINRAQAQVLGIKDPEEAIGKTDFDFFTEEHAQGAYADEQEFVKSGQPLIDKVERIRRADGQTRWVSTTKVSIMDEKGQVAGIVGISRDITERQQAQEEIRRHLERIEALRKVDKAITSTLDLKQVLDTILAELERVIPYHSAAIFLLSDGTAKVSAARGHPDVARALEVSFPVQDDALIAELMQEMHPLVLADAQADERFLARGGTGYVRSWIGVPLIAKEKAVGFLTIDHREPGVYDEESAEMAQDFASQVAMAVENARLYEAAQQELAERKRAERLLRALNQAATAMERALTPEEIFTTVAEELKKLGFSCVILLTDESQKRLLPKYFSYEAKAIKAAEKLVSLKAEGLSIPVEAVDVYRKVVRERETVFVEDAEEVVRQLLPGPAKRLAKRIAKMLKVSKSIDAPLIVEDEVIGLLLVQSDDLTEDDMPAITAFAHQMAAAWRKASLLQDLEGSLAERKRAQEELRQSYAKLQRTLEETVHALASAVEMRDPYTAGHQRRVTELACAIATEMGLPQERIEGLRMAGLIHDIGKINVPAEILSKPGPLNTTEFALIKAHPQVGHDILKEIYFPWPVAQIVLQHHERLNGSGYPQGLQGEEMLLEARILAVADVVEAMGSRRPYRPTLGIDKALKEISENKGVLYDPKVVDVCLRLFAEDRFHFEE